MTPELYKELKEVFERLNKTIETGTYTCLHGNSDPIEVSHPYAFVYAYLQSHLITCNSYLEDSENV